MAAKANTVEDKHTGIYVNRELSWLKFNESHKNTKKMKI